MSLTTKWSVYIRDPREALAPGHFKTDYAFDDEGRMWRRIYTANVRGYRKFSKCAPWHIADPYTWFPANSLEPPGRARKQNTRAQLPKKFDRYIVKGERIEVPR